MMQNNLGLFADVAAIVTVVVVTIAFTYFHITTIGKKIEALCFFAFCCVLLLAAALSGTELGVYGIGSFLLLSALTCFPIAVAVAKDVSAPQTGQWISPSENRAILTCIVIAIFTLSLYASGVKAGPIGDMIHHYDVFQYYYRSIRSGLVPYFDFPVQYGGGPLLVASLGAKTLRSFFVVTCFFNAILAGTLYLIATNAGKTSRAYCLMAACSIFAGSLYLSAFPGQGVITPFYPSIGGMRYLPIAISAYILVSRERTSWLTSAACVFATSAWSFEAGLITFFGFGTALLSKKKLAPIVALLLPFAAGVILAPAVTLAIYGKIDWSSVVEFIGSSTPHSIQYRFLTVTIALVGLVTVPIFYENARGPQPVLTGFILALFIYPAMRGHPTTLLNVFPFVLALVLNFASVKYPRAGSTVSIVATILALYPYAATPSLLMPQIDAKKIVNEKVNEITSADINREREMTTSMGCRGLWIPGVGVPAPDDPDLNKRTSVWTLLPSERIAIYQERFNQSSGRLVDQDYCWMNMRSDLAVNFEDLARKLKLTSKQSLNDGRVLFYSPSNGNIITR